MDDEKERETADKTVIDETESSASVKPTAEEVDSETAVSEPDAESPVEEKTRRKIGKKTVIKAAAIVVAVIFVLQCIFSVVFYSLVLVKGSSSGVKKMMGVKGTAAGEDSGRKWVTENSTDRELTNAGGLKLHAYYIKSGNVSHSYAILCHPYSTDGTAMAAYAKHYYDLGFNILLPDARGHGKSEGTVSMGWLDRLDLVEWINQILKDDPNANIILHGVSMGGAEVAMAAGENLPANVRFIVDDSGYSSVSDLFRFQFGKLFSLPAFPTVNLASGFTKLRAGWSFGEASTLKQVKKSKTPILFIHGSADEFVPITQSNELFDACSSERKQVVISGAGHAQCMSKDSGKYWSEVNRFMLKYFSF